MASLFGRVPEEVWQDREIRFDAPPAQLQPRRGEEVLETLVRSLALQAAARAACMRCCLQHRLHGRLHVMRPRILHSW